MAKQPFLPLFFGDFLASTAEWTGEEQALYLLLLGYQWSRGSLPLEPNRVGLLCRYHPDAFANLWRTVREKFSERDGRLVNLRLEEHRERSDALSEKRSKVGKLGAASRWQSPSDSEANATGSNGNSQSMSMPSIPSHPIPSQSIPSHRERKGERAKPFDPATVPNLNLAAWTEWVGYRSARKPAIKPASMAKAAQQMADLGPLQRAAVDHSIANGYQGLIAPKDGPHGRRDDSPRPGTYDHSKQILDRRLAESRALLAGDARAVRPALGHELRDDPDDTLDLSDLFPKRKGAEDDPASDADERGPASADAA